MLDQVRSVHLLYRIRNVECWHVADERRHRNETQLSKFIDWELLDTDETTNSVSKRFSSLISAPPSPSLLPRIHNPFSNSTGTRKSNRFYRWLDCSIFNCRTGLSFFLQLMLKGPQLNLNPFSYFLSMVHNLQIYTHWSTRSSMIRRGGSQRVTD